MNKAVIEKHEDVAQVAFGVVLSLGAVALAGLVFIRKRATPQWFAASVLVLALVTTGLLAWTANLGGKVRHTEITNGSPGIASTAIGDRD